MTRPVKPCGSLDEHLAKLEQRGMVLAPVFAARWLGSVGSYRLSGYWYSYRVLNGNERGDSFEAGTSVADVVALHEFDRKLRTLVHDGVERVEVMLRTRLNATVGASGALAYRERTHSRPTFHHAAWLATAQRRVARSRRRSDAVQHHDEHYSGQLPIWVLSEVLDFADVSRLYEGLPARAQWEIAEQLGVQIDLGSLTRARPTGPRSTLFDGSSS